jgi:DNA primase
VLETKRKTIFHLLQINSEEYGATLYSCCPIHDESDNPKAFSYNVNNNTWKCWTRNCHEEYKSDIFGLIAGVLSKRSGTKASFSEVLSWIFKNLNVDNKGIEKTEVAVVEKDPFTSLVGSFYKKTKVCKKPECADIKRSIPSSYFVNERHFEKETMTEFSVGDCLDKNSVYKYRAIIPIDDENGVRVGFMARAMKDYMEPKFLIEKGFEKRHYLYNHHRAKSVAVEKSCLFIVEGQGDVWRLWECGVKNVVGLFGKEVSTFQEEKINSMGITKLVVLLDHDQAGRESKVKIKRMFNRYYKLYFPQIETKRDIGQMSPEDVHGKILFNFKGLY